MPVPHRMNTIKWLACSATLGAALACRSVEAQTSAPDQATARVLFEQARTLLKGCALLANGGVSCWSTNTYGEMGNGTTMPSLTATPVTF